MKQLPVNEQLNLDKIKSMLRWMDVDGMTPGKITFMAYAVDIVRWLVAELEKKE